VRYKNLAHVAMLVFGLIALPLALQPLRAQKSTPAAPVIPKTWDDEAIATLEIPLADPVGSPKHVSSEYYYRIPVAPIYKSYPVYVPGHEPPGYLHWLKQQEPVVVWDEAGHAPPRTDAFAAFRPRRRRLRRLDWQIPQAV
jgi:hypothetical protein